jgi:malonyl-CoA/methylmalonyl-CoA synthetase
VTPRVLPAPDQWAHHAADDFEPTSLTTDGSLPRRWARIWAEAPDRPTLHTPEEGRWLIAAEVEERTARCARVLAGLGASPGERVVVCADDPIMAAIWNLGALRAGAIVVPVNPAYRAQELAHILLDSEPAVVVAGSDDHAGWAAESSPGVPIIHTSAPPDVDADVTLDQVGLDDPALLPYTSGTTGRPKGALLTHGNLLACTNALQLAWRWTPDDRLILALPLFHVHGLVVGLYGTLAAGASAVVLTSFSPAGVADAIAAHDATVFFGVPTMYTRLVDQPSAPTLRELRLCVSGSAPLPPEIFHQIERVTGHRVLERYGMTEALMIASNPYDGERRPGHVGFALPGVELRLAGGDEGEIQLRGPSVFSGYWRNEAADAEAFTADGWFRSGDLGDVREGSLRIAGRAKELIITGGYNVYPREVEDALLELPGVREVAVVGRPSTEWGETITAFIVRDSESLEVDAIKAHCAERLASYKRPRSVTFVDSLPRNALGKIMRNELQ